MTDKVDKSASLNAALQNREAQLKIASESLQEIHASLMSSTKEVQEAQEARQLPDPTTTIQTLQSELDSSRKENQRVNASSEQILRDKLALNATIKEQETEYQQLQQHRSELELYSSLQKTLIFELDQTCKSQEAITVARRNLSNASDTSRKSLSKSRDVDKPSKRNRSRDDHPHPKRGRDNQGDSYRSSSNSKRAELSSSAHSILCDFCQQFPKRYREKFAA